MKISHLTSTAYHLLSNRLLWWKEHILASRQFRGFQRTWTFLLYVENLEIEMKNAFFSSIEM